MFDIIVHRHDNLPVIQKTAYLNGAPMDLSGYTAKILVFSIDGTVTYIDKAATIAGSAVQYQFTDADADSITSDYAFMQFQVINGANDFTLPNNRPLSMLLTSATRHEYSYSGDPSARPLDRVRFLLGDTDMDTAVFTDSELQFLLDEFSDVYLASAEAASRQAGVFAKFADKTVGPLSIRYGDQSSRWYELAKSLRGRGARQGGAVAIMTQSSTDHHFILGIHDGPASYLPNQWGDDGYCQ